MTCTKKNLGMGSAENVRYIVKAIVNDKGFLLCFGNAQKY